jgi:FAD/FMN-containing dehydrogenase
VVTRFTYRLHPVGPSVYGGLIAWPFERAEEVMAAYRTITSRAPRELTVFLVLLNAPPAPFVPPAWQGRRIVAMAVCYSGDLDRADQVVAPIRALADPVFDLLGELPYTQVQSYLDDGEPKGDHYYWKTEYLAELNDGLLSAAREVFAECPMPDGEVGFLQLDGALNERHADDGAVGNRDTRFAVGVKGRWQADGADTHGFLKWVRDGGERLRPFSTGRTYINFQTADEGEDRVRATYGDNFDRLVQVKQRYDPDNLFRSNRNIPPAGIESSR